MTTGNAPLTATPLLVLTALLVTATDVRAQQPARPGETGRSDPARSVTLSLTEYNRLIDLANRQGPLPAGAPVAAVLAGADLRVRVERDVVQGRFQLTGEVLRPGYHRVALIAGATVTEATADGRPLPLVADANADSALLQGPGPFAVTLGWGTPLTFAPGRASFTLPVPPAGSARATIEIAGEQADVHLSSGVITRRTVADGRTVVDATLRPGAPVEVWWSMRDSAPVAAAREVRMLADVFTLVTIGDSDVRMAALVDVAVVQGDARTIDVRLPGGYELSGISGATIEASEPRDGGVVLTVVDPAARRHQFLVALERSHAGGSFTMDSDVVSLPGVQRERGEIAVEGVGTLELTAVERSGMHRVDVRELNAALQSLARLPLLSAFRYQRTAAAPVALALDVQRFANAGVLAAVADRAVATTLVTAEGRALTEVVLHLRNRAQPFLKVTLPTGATIVSVEVAGESAKPVVGADGTRVPLLRPGFRPSGVYQVSYVYMHAGAAFAKKGELPMSLPKMDVPVGIVEWEMFVPANYRVQAVDGNMISRTIVDQALDARRIREQAPSAGPTGGSVGGVTGGIVGGGVRMFVEPGLPGQVHGIVRDVAGAPLPGVVVTLAGAGTTKSAVSGPDGSFAVTGVPSGPVTVTAAIAGFAPVRQQFSFDQQPRRLEFAMAVGPVTESLTVTAAETPRPDAAKAAQPSMNVQNLQRRAAGVLPIRIDVPKAGTSHRFVKPLVVDQEATVSLRYRRK
jgi:hypothetical protein